MKKSHFILFFCFSTLFADASEIIGPDSLRNVYENYTICPQFDIGSGGFIYKKNGQVRMAGRFAKNMIPDLNGSSEATLEAIKASSIMKKGFAMTMGGALLTGIGGAAAIIVTPIGWAGVIAGLAIEMIGTKKMGKGQNHLYKAIWLYNRDVLVNGVR